MGTEMQGPDAVTPAEMTVACAIFCCDQKEYSLKNTRGGRKTCQRLGNRKHSCVLHSLREKKGNKLTTKDKFPGVQASPRFPGPGRTLIPDTIVNGNKIIDAKFPCETDKVHGPNNTPPGTGPGFTVGKALRAYPSISKPGTEMSTSKESHEYKDIADKVECMTPQDAAAKKGDCKCA